MRESKFFKDLLLLKDYNILYKNIIITFDLTNTQKEKFNLIKIFSKVLQYNKNI